VLNVDAHDENHLPEQPGDETRNALNDLPVRIGLEKTKAGIPAKPSSQIRFGQAQRNFAH
jgi:hypothetical protein